MDDLDSLSSLGPSFLISGIEVGPDGRPRPPLLTPWDWQAVLPLAFADLLSPLFLFLVPDMPCLPNCKMAVLPLECAVRSWGPQ